MATVEIGSYNTNFYPTLLEYVDAVEPINEDFRNEEVLSPDLLYIQDRDRRLGCLATDRWFDLMSFQLCMVHPAEKHIDTKSKNPFSPTYMKLRTKWPLAAPTTAFTTMCHIAEPEIDEPRHELAIMSRPTTVRAFVGGIRIYSESQSNPHHIDYLLVARSLVRQVATSERSFNRSIGPRQWEVIDSLLQKPRGPRLWPDYDKEN